MNVKLFVPSFGCPETEEFKHEVLDYYGKLLNMPTVYKTLKETEKEKPIINLID